MSDVIRLRLRKGREKAVRQGHPWLFSGAVESAEGPGDAALARVLSARVELLGVGFHAPGSRIRARMLAGAGDAPIDRAFFRRRLEEAAALRAATLPAATDGYRLLNAEGDDLPGWTVDRFGDVLVSQVTSAGLERLREEAYPALAELHPDAAVLELGDLRARRLEGLPVEDRWVRGEPRGEAVFRESGLAFAAELAGGQKTGFYCDQRPNRRLAERLAGGRRALDLFAHAGAFSLYALRGGATSTVAVESSARLAERAAADRLRNGLDDGRAAFVTADVFAWLRQADADQRFDLVVCDPPPLARRRAETDAAARAYKDLNRLALARLAPGGFLLTFSCSGAIDARLFRQILFAAARDAGVRLALLHPLAAGEDHPVAVTHPEGEYLKGWLAVVRGPR